MSFALNLDNLLKEEKTYIIENCTVKSKTDQYTNTSTILRLYSVDKSRKEVILPFAKWEEFYESFPNVYNYKKLSDGQFKGELKSEYPRDQTAVCAEALDILYEKHSVLLALYTGFGKTILSIYLSLKLRLKTVVICSIRALHQQWKDRFEQFTNLKVQIVKAKKIDPTADVYILGAKKTANFTYSEFTDVGTVIVDEVDRICTQTFSLSLHRLRPRFLIGCSATPDRTDGLDKTLYSYFPEKFIFREEVKNFTVIKYKTTFRPEIRSNFKGSLDWTFLQNSLSYNTNRHLLICKLVQKYYKNHKIIIMVKRVDEILSIHDLLEEKGLDVDYVSQTKSDWNNEVKVLIGTFSKIGIGLDITNRDVTILAGDVKDIRQPEGRTRLSNNIIVDIVDSYSTLEKHWQQRRKWYLKRGARILYEGKKEKKIGENCWLLPETE